MPKGHFPEHPVVEAEQARDARDLARAFEPEQEQLAADLVAYDEDSLSEREREDMGLPPRPKR